MESNQILAHPKLWEGQEPSQGSQGLGGAASWLSAAELRRPSLSVLPDHVFSASKFTSPAERISLAHLGPESLPLKSGQVGRHHH